jgi:hypothetical protein
LFKTVSSPLFQPFSSFLADSWENRGVKIELLYWDGCPSHPEALELLQTVLAERGLEASIELREVRTDEEAQALRFPGSPTIRIDGRDVDAFGSEARPALTCRIYHLADGRVSPIPSREQLEEALT